MKLNVISLLICIVVLVNACKPDREFEAPDDQAPIGGAGNILVGTLCVNEFITTGSLLASDLDTMGTSDWLEIYNTTQDTIYLGDGKWSITDSLEWVDKWILPDTIILPNARLVIFCDDRDTVTTQLHASFKLSSGGEDLGLYYKKSNGDYLKVDGFEYNAQSAGVCQQRFPDGTSNWVFSNNTTPGLPNIP